MMRGFIPLHIHRPCQFLAFLLPFATAVSEFSVESTGPRSHGHIGLSTSSYTGMAVQGAPGRRALS